MRGTESGCRGFALRLTIALGAGCVLPHAAGAAVVTPRVLVGFDGQLSGNTYTLGPGEIDATGSFRKNGSASIAGGAAEVPGNVDAASGFLFNSAALGSLTTTSWVSEAVLIADAPASGQPGTFTHFLDVQGDLFFRYNGVGASTVTQYGFYDGSSEPTRTTPELSTTEYSHVALAWDAPTRTLEGFIDGVSQGTLSTGGLFATPSTNVGYGFFSRSGFLNRAFDGKLESVAFSTYTGSFTPGFGDGFDFQLDPDDTSPLGLYLVVNTVSGAVSIVNDTTSAIGINGYEIASESAALDVSSTGWTSLADQGLDPVLGGDGPGETWQEGAFVSAGALLETFLLGGTTIAPGETLSLGRAFDEAVAAQDLTFNYRIMGQSGLLVGDVTYDSTPPEIVPGDYNNDGFVDAADYTVWRDNEGSGATLPNDETPGVVDSDDYEAWRQNYGAVAGDLPLGAASAVPAPAALSLLGLATLCLSVASRRAHRIGMVAAAVACCGTGAKSSAQSPPTPYLQTPSDRQMAWHEQEYYAFIHFGPNTFNDEEWGWSQSTPDSFNPTNLDTDQWAETFRDAGMTGMILTAKHHDGMALWDTASTEYQIANGTWAQSRVSQGLDANVVRMAAESAKKYGLNFGIYLSPWDMHRDPAVAKPHLAGTIYDEPQVFGDSTPGDYNDLYAQQLTELVTMELSDGSPIEISEVWLDGASGSNTVQTFDWTRYRDIIRQNQPDAVMWGHQGVDARWVGNEEGTTVDTNWHTISRTQDQARYSPGQLEVGVRDGLYWTPAEADARLRSGWFYHDDEDPKSPGELMEMYFSSVGRSVNLLLDVPPDTTGQLVQEDIDALIEFKSERDAFLDRNLVDEGLGFSASNVRGGFTEEFGPANVADGDTDTYWALDDGQTTGSFEIDFGGPRSVDAFVVQEHIALGQRIGGYAIDAFVNGVFQTVATGTSMGYKRIERLGAPVETSRVRFRVTQANATPIISEFQALGEVLIGATGDLNFDGQVDLDDWVLFAANTGADLSGYSPEEAFARGDMNADGRNDLTDFDLFVTAYEETNGASSFVRDVATLSTPEPGALACLLALLSISGTASPRLVSRRPRS